MTKQARSLSDETTQDRSWMTARSTGVRAKTASRQVVQRRRASTGFISLAVAILGRGLGGHVSRSSLLTTLLPLSCVSLFGTLAAAALLIPIGYDWRVQVISTLTSPQENPAGYWLPSVGMMTATVLAFPFAGYVGLHLYGITPRLARSAKLAFTLSFVLMFLAVGAQIIQAAIGLRWIHELLARASTGSFVAGMFCCCGCALKGRFRRCEGEGSLPVVLVLFWVSLLLVPILCLISTGALVLLGQQLGQTWAEEIRQSFRHTVLWHLAFWEWAGAVVASVFLAGSALFLPASK